MMPVKLLVMCLLLSLMCSKYSVCDTYFRFIIILLYLSRDFALLLDDFSSALK